MRSFPSILHTYSSRFNRSTNIFEKLIFNFKLLILLERDIRNDEEFRFEYLPLIAEEGFLTRLN